MKIRQLHVTGYRTLEEVSITFPHSYAAISGKNDSGKTNLLRALETLLGGDSDSPRHYRFLGTRSEFTKWRESERASRLITIGATLEIDKQQDAGLFEFLTTYLALEEVSNSIHLKVQVQYAEKRPLSNVTVETGGLIYSDIKAEEILKNLQSSPCFLLYDSTEPDYPFLSRRSVSVLSRDFSPEYATLMDSVKKQVDSKLAEIAAVQQNELSQLLGRLQEKYELRLTLPNFDPGAVPVDITLGTKGYDVPLGYWGSGTRNRTRILLTLFRAKQISESPRSAAKITPIIVIEEPESFLHPAAQAEFGRVLQDIAEEFNVQVIVATHSPYMLSLSQPDSNILLDRELVDGNARATRRIETQGESWMKPFALALGVDNAEFKPWKELFDSASTSILLVEGQTDKAYFEMLRDEVHGDNRLKFQGEILSYDGCGNLKNTVLLRFIMNRYKRVVITYDLDVESQVVGALKSLGFVQGRDFLGIGPSNGIDQNIEGLIPDIVKKQVYGEHPHLVNKLMGNDTNERDKAKRMLKQQFLEKFQELSIPGDITYFGEFYTLTERLNQCLQQSETHE